MAIVQFPGGLCVPPPLAFSTTGPNFPLAPPTIDVLGEKVSFIITVPKTGTLERFEFLTGAVTLNAASIIKVSFQDVNASENPDGTVDEYRLINGSDISSTSWIVPGTLTNDGTDGGTKRSVTRGQRLACVIEFDTFNVLDSMVVRVVATDTIANWIAPNFTLTYDGALWSKSASQTAILALRYDDGTYEQIIGAYPIKALNSPIFSSTASPDERGLLFQLPAPMLVGGVIIRMAGSLGISVPIVLYDQDGTTILRTSNLAGFPDTNGKHYNLRFNSDVRLEANVPYRLTVKPAANNITLYDFEVDSSDLMNMIEGGSTWQYCERTDDGNWTDTVNKRPWMSLWVTGIDHDISGGSGGGGSGGIE
jgi:hypothetical protein